MSAPSRLTAFRFDTDTRAVHRGAVSRLVRSTPFYIFAIDVVLIVTFGLISRNNVFWSLPNIQAILGDGAQAILLATAVTLLLSAGIFDLSLGANLVLSSVIGGSLLAQRVPFGEDADLATTLLGLIVCVGVGAAVGLVNGVLVSALHINSIIATLGTLSIATGFSFLLTHGSDVTGIPSNLQTMFGLNNFLGVPLPAILAVAVLVAFWAVLRFTRFGLRTLAIGSNEVSAERAGLRVGKHLLLLMVIAGTLAGLAGFIDLARFGTTNTSGHTLDGLAALTAAVVGGTSLLGGRASMFGSLWGAVLAYVLLNGLVVVGLPSFWQQVATGVILIVAVAIDSARTWRRP